MITPRWTTTRQAVRRPTREPAPDRQGVEANAVISVRA